VTGRAGAVVLFLVLAIVGPATPAGAVPILDPLDAQELVQELAEATAVQGICYGWQVTVRDDAGIYTGTDLGSSLGVGVTPVGNRACPRFVVFQADLRYTAESSESEDSASFLVLANVGGGPDDRDLRRVGVTEESLLGSKDDLGLINAVQALPALVAEKRLAAAVPPEPTEGTIPAADRPTNRPGSDWTRAYGEFLGVAAVMVLGGLGWAGWAWASDRLGPNTDE
jgi:hypothetical protein